MTAMPLELREQTVIFGVVLSVFWAGLIFALLVQRARPFASFVSWFRGNPALGRVLALCAIISVAVYGGSKGEGNNLRQTAPTGRRDAPAAQMTMGSQPVPGIGLVEVRTNGVSFAASSTDAVEVTAWRRVGGTEMGCWIASDSPFFALGTNAIARAFAAASGAISFESARRPPTGAALPDGAGLSALCPLRAPLGFVPEAALPPDAPAQRFWHDSAPGGGLVLTWENALLDRMPGRAVSFQAELRPTGDCVFRYEFPDILDPPPENFGIGAQMWTNGVNALAILGTNIISTTVWRVGGCIVSNGVSVAELLCTNGMLRTPLSFELQWRNTTGLAPNGGDSDGDGVSDWDETFLLGTDFNLADTDGDGIDDGAESLAGTNPLDADEDSNGIPDGADATSYFANPLWAASGAGNIVVSLDSAIPPGSSATLLVGGLAIPLRQEGDTSLTLPDGAELDFRLFATGPAPVRLSLSPGPDWNGDGFWLEDPSGVFTISEMPTRAGARAAAAPQTGLRGTGSGAGGAGSHGGSGRLGWVRFSLVASDPTEWDHESAGEYCVTSGGPLHLSLRKNGAQIESGSVNVSLDGLSGDAAAPSLDVPGTGWASLHGVFLRWGEITASVSAHHCDAAENQGACSHCGHSPGFVGPASTNMILTLKHDADSTLDVPVTGRGEDEPQIVSRRVEIRRQNESTWYPLCIGEFPRNQTIKVAGHFLLRPVAVDSDGHEYYGEESEMEVRFPTYEQITHDSGVSSAMESAWVQTINDCRANPNERREIGFWIRLNTALNVYILEPRLVGDYVGPEVAAYLTVYPRPDDMPANPLPNSPSATYTIGLFHTHTPRTYLPNPVYYRLVGPSNADVNFVNSEQVVGIVYDYVGSPSPTSSTNELYNGHPIDAPRCLYPIPPNRRPTP